MSGINTMGSERDITQRIDSDALTTENLPTGNDRDNYVRDSSDTKHSTENVGGSDHDVTTSTRSHDEKHTSRSSYSTSSGGESGGVSTGRYKVKTADEEVEDALRGARDKVGRGTDEVGQKGSEVKDAVKGAAGDIKGEADRAAGEHQRGVDEAKGEAGKKWDQTKDKAGQLAGSVQDTAGAAGQAVGEKAGQVKDALGHGAGVAGRRGEQAGKAAEDDARIVAEETRDNAKGLFGGIQNIVGEASAVIQDTVNAPGEHITRE